jgi:PadR family transcriptional regulator, regulatory protein PadR
MGKGKKDQLSGTLDLLILKTLAQAGPSHGYGIVLHIQRVSDNLLRVEEGSLYPALHRIEEAGWVSSEWRTTKNNRRAKYYRLTPSGRKQVAREEQSWERVVQGVSSILRFA